MHTMNKKLWIILVLMSGIVKSQDLTVMTYNIRYDNPKDSLDGWEQRSAFLSSQVRFLEPAVFGTQEGLHHQLEDLTNALPGYEFFGKGRDHGDQRGEYSAVFYKKDQLRLLDQGTFWLSETPDIPSVGWDAALNRVCTYGLFNTLEGDKKFYVFNAHLDHMGETARQKSLELIIEKVKTLNTDQYPVILMGDFNLEPDHPSIKQLSGEMKDAHDLAPTAFKGPTGTYNGFNMDELPTRRIDYIFLSPGDFSVQRYRIISEMVNGRYPSDHFPVVARLRFLP
ncbi:endonuclease/exonuclease/phosphatase family protein [Zeaxanthinibacter sp. PT1]|uniref:endonuclease/exonuclease/phosphatase family protein n=1 Tax=Zeaxanthinibacter TaxID=561554 RepID=UPI0023494D4B|nr:endonuclease/exonuclease/phosphatase family protein [Zeaxanthinibacter sp. PT1]MDC6350800.1 endonuclease/exonuclease/phosphatase family protein [Zeaxanthinibacter sp. PT1]